MTAILLYHSVAEDVVDDQLQVRPSTILRHLAWCRAEGYEPAPLAEALRHSTEKLVAVTFDDGFASVRLVWPELRARGIQPTIFVCPGCVGAENRWASPGRVRERLLDLSAIRALSGEGIAMGCHGWDHRPFRRRTVPDLEDDLGRCVRWFVRALNCRTPVFAWPYGAFDRAALSVVRRYHDYAMTAGPASGQDVTRWDVPRVAAAEGLDGRTFEERLDLGAFFLEPSTRDCAGPFLA